MVVFAYISSKKENITVYFRLIQSHELLRHVFVQGRSDKNHDSKLQFCEMQIMVVLCEKKLSGVAMVSRVSFIPDFRYRYEDRSFVSLPLLDMSQPSAHCQVSQVSQVPQMDRSRQISLLPCLWFHYIIFLTFRYFQIPLLKIRSYKMYWKKLQPNN